MLTYVLKTIAQIAVISLLFYKAHDVLRFSRAVAITHALAFYAVVTLASGALGLDVLVIALKYSFIPFLIIMVMVYQDDIKAAVASGRSSMGIIRKRENRISSSELGSILNALYSLAEMKRGALVVIRKSDRLEEKILNAPTQLNCAISSNVIVTIFGHDTPLHDGAIVIDKNQISLAGCVLPTSKQGAIKASDPYNSDGTERTARRDLRKGDKIFGTRHRAALGITEVSDAIAVVVSEETKALSVCHRSSIYYDLGYEDAASLLGQLIGYEEKSRKE